MGVRKRIDRKRYRKRENVSERKKLEKLLCLKNEKEKINDRTR